MTHGERKRHSSNAATRIVEAIDSVSTSLRMAWAASRANTAGPAVNNLRVAGFGARKGLPDCGIHRVLAGDVHATGTGSGQDQRTVPLGGEPHAVHAAHLARANPGARDREEGAGRVGRSELLHQRGGGRLQSSQQTLHVVAQHRDGEGLGRGDRRQQIPMAEQDLLIGRSQPDRRPPLLTKANWPERSRAPVMSRLIRASTSAGAPSMPRMTRLVAAPERNSLQHQARGIAATARQEVRHVGADRDVAEHQPCQQRRTGQRECDRTAPPVTQRFTTRGGLKGTGLMVMRISSPFACVV